MIRSVLIVFLSVLIASCGGGGGGGGGAVSIPNRAPTITDPGALSILEGASRIVSLGAEDADGDILSFSIISGDDQSLFTITSSGILSFAVAPDYELPTDVDTNNVYLLSVEVTDGALTDNQALTITITNAFEGRVVDAPISGASVFVDLNGNNIQDIGEPSGTTDANGYFNVDSFALPTDGQAKVVSKGGIDTMTGKALPGLALVSDLPSDLTKPANVTPLTTVLSVATTPEAKAQVLAALGISGSVEELLTSDGWADAEAGNENAKANQRMNQQIGMLLQTATTLTDDGDESNDVSIALAESVASQISTTALAQGNIDLTASATIQSVLTDAAQDVTPTLIIETAVFAAVANATAMVNTVVADVTLDPLSDTAKEVIESAQNGLQASIVDVVSGDVSVASFAETTDASELFSNVTVAADAPDNDSDGISDVLDPDDDNDEVRDSADAFPLDSTETLDTDSDGTGNNADADDDGDGVADSSDAFSLDASETLDTDSDGTGNNADTDDDGDGVADGSDVFPLDSTETLDTDSDGTGNNADTDDDGDGVADGSDAFPLDSTETLDTDSDGTGNNADTDDDGDGVADGSDAFPLDSTETIDTDSDGTGNNADTDDDGDGVADSSDDYPLNANVHTAPTASSASYFINLLPKTTNAAGATLASTSQGSRAVTYSIATNATNGTVTLTNSSTGTFSYSTTQTDAVEDYFTFKVNDGFVDSATSRVDISLKTDPLYKYQWHLDNTGQTSFASNGGTSGADLNVDTAIASGMTGEGVVVAIVDSGLEIAHEDIADNVVTNGSWNYSNSTTDPTPSGSGSDHGTMVAGIVAAKGWNNLGGRGVAPNASIRAFNLIAGTNSTITNEANALGASNPYATDVSIFNMSYGGSTLAGDPTLAAINLPPSVVSAQLLAGTTDLRNGKGALYVNSTGNDYYKGDDGDDGDDGDPTSRFSYCGDGVNASPLKIGCYDAIFDGVFGLPYIVGVAALDADNIKAKYSTPGAATWVSAYGGDYGVDDSYTSGGNYSNSSVSIPYKPAVTTIDRSSCSNGNNSSNGVRFNALNDYQNPHSENPNCNYTNTMNGTSSAAPMVSGVIALMLEANPDLTWRDVKHILATTAVQVDSSFSANSLNGISYVGWNTNSIGLKFHPWYGFGAVDATAAVNSAISHTSLSSHSFTSWNDSPEYNTYLWDYQLNTHSLEESGAGTIEHVKVRVSFSHRQPNSLGFRLESPSGTVITLLPPLTTWFTDPGLDTWVYLPANAFYGESKVGTWKLYTVDHYGQTGGYFAQWGIKFMYR